jgi:hypothetical protein
MRKEIVGSLVVMSTLAMWACSSSSSGGSGATGGDAGDGGGNDSGGSTGGEAGSSEAGSSSGNDGGGGSETGGNTEGGGGEGGPTGPTWTLVSLMDDPGHDGGAPQTYKTDAKVAGIWFSATSNGDVALLTGDNATAGAVEHLSSATAVDSIAFSGVGAGFNGPDDQYNALWWVARTARRSVVRST